MSGRKVLLASWLLIGIYTSAQDISARLSSLKMTSIDGSIYSCNLLKNNKASVIIFLSPDCPLCQNYTLIIRQMEETFEKEGISFYGIFPGTWYSVGGIKKFKADYHLNFNMLLDKDKVLAHLLNAKVTPEVFVLNNDCKIVYRGRIDNWMYAAGKKRTVITTHELKDALNSIVNNKPIVVSKTEAVGCLIE